MELEELARAYSAGVELAGGIEKARAAYLSGGNAFWAEEILNAALESEGPQLSQDLLDKVADALAGAEPRELPILNGKQPSWLEATLLCSRKFRVHLRETLYGPSRNPRPNSRKSVAIRIPEPDEVEDAPPLSMEPDPFVEDAPPLSMEPDPFVEEFLRRELGEFRYLDLVADLRAEERRVRGTVEEEMGQRAQGLLEKELRRRKKDQQILAGLRGSHELETKALAKRLADKRSAELKSEWSQVRRCLREESPLILLKLVQKTGNGVRLTTLGEAVADQLCNS